MSRPLLEVNHLNKSYGKQVVVKDVSFVVGEGQKIALIGRNGSGKTTLMNMLTGAEERDSGDFKIFDRTRVGVIRQHEVLPGDVSVAVFLEQRTGKPVWTIAKLASEFGLHTDHLEKTAAQLSGGYQMRVKIVAMLLEEPNLLLLDEPVNYLDLNTLLLLEHFLKSYKGSFILVAHDREFLENTCTTTFELERGELTTYVGTVENYLVFKEEQREFALRTNKKLAREIEHHQEFVDRFGVKATMASRAQSKVKHIAKLRKKIAGVHADLATTKIKIQCPMVPPGTAVYAEEVSVGYGDKVIVDKINFHINRGDKVVIAGENGQGKTTLLKTLAGILEPLSGKLKWWHHADIGYYDQKVDATLIANETVLNYLMRMAPHVSSGERILMMAGNFLFRDDDLEKPTSVLSGGERARLCLAGILLHEHSVLLLDEPTNHLDVETAEALAVALKQYDGTVILVSHARTFVNALCDKVLEIRFGTLRNYPGPYEEYVADLAEIMAMEADSTRTPSFIKEGAGGGRTDVRAERAEARSKLKELQRAVERLEKLMKVLDRERSEILQFYFDNPTEYAPEKATRLGELDEEYKRKEDEWFKLQEQIEELS